MDGFDGYLFGICGELMNNQSEYTCGGCKETFLKGRTDQEADAERDALFPDLKEEDRVLVCETCFVQCMDYNEPGLKRYIPYVDKKQYETNSLPEYRCPLCKIISLKAPLPENHLKYLKEKFPGLKEEDISMICRSCKIEMDSFAEKFVAENKQEWSRFWNAGEIDERFEDNK